MKGTTHLMVGAAVGVPVAALFAAPYLVGVSLIAALVPDLDAPDATLKHYTINLGDRRTGLKIKPFSLISSVMTMIFPHRGFVHSLYAALSFVLVAGLLTYWLYVPLWLGWTLALFVGYLSHLLTDAMTPTGIPLLMKGQWHALPPGWRIRTGSDIEHLFVAVSGVIVLGYFVSTMS